MKFIENIFINNSKIIDIDNKKSLSIKSMFKNEKLNTIKKKELAFLLSENSIGFIFFYIYLLKKNYTILLVNVENYKQLKKIYKPSIEVLPNFLIQKFNYEKKYIKKKKYNFIMIKNTNSNNYKIHKEICLLLSTSGSTGSKKFVKISYENLESNIRAIINSLDLMRTDSTITTMPPEYSYGLSVINTHLNVGATIYLNNYSIFDKSFLIFFKNQKITNLNGVPIFYDLLKKIKFFSSYTQHIRFFTQAGGALNDDTRLYILKELNTSNTKFYIMYGSTETSPRMSCFELSKNSNTSKGCIGLPIDDYQIKIKNPKGKGGLIYFYGKNIFKGYAKNFKSLISVKNYKYINTGDVGEFGKDGFYYIKSRNKRIIKISGVRIALDEIESLLFSNFKQRVRCIGFEDSLICFFEKKIYNPNELIVFLSKNLKINHKFIKINNIKNFPLTDRGKVNYEKLRSLSKIN
jgi:acyl-CoA synthetase (AMP-forming)/AMP-acid ligase II